MADFNESIFKFTNEYNDEESNFISEHNINDVASTSLFINDSSFTLTALKQELSTIYISLDNYNISSNLPMDENSEKSDNENFKLWEIIIVIISIFLFATILIVIIILITRHCKKTKKHNDLALIENPKYIKELSNVKSFDFLKSPTKQPPIYKPKHFINNNDKNTLSPIITHTSSKRDSSNNKFTGFTFKPISIDKKKATNPHMPGDINLKDNEDNLEVQKLLEDNIGENDVGKYKICSNKSIDQISSKNHSPFIYNKENNSIGPKSISNSSRISIEFEDSSKVSFDPNNSHNPEIPGININPKSTRNSSNFTNENYTKSDLDNCYNTMITSDDKNKFADIDILEKNDNEKMNSDWSINSYDKILNPFYEEK